MGAYKYGLEEDERGGYKGNPHRDAIIDALRALKYQSLRHLTQNTGLSADKIEPVVTVDDSISHQLVGSIPVYFLNENAPDGKLYNSGGKGGFLVKKAAKNKKINQKIRV